MGADSTYAARTVELPPGVMEGYGELAMVTWLYDRIRDQVIWSYPAEEFFGFTAGTEGFSIRAHVDEAASGEAKAAAGGSSGGEGRSIGELLFAPIRSALACVGDPPRDDHRIVVVCPDGTERSVLHRCWSVAPGEGEGAYGAGLASMITGVVLDVTGQERFERALGGLVDRFRLLSEVSPDAVVVHQDGGVVYANQSALALFEIDDAESEYGHSIVDFVHPDDISAVASRIGSLVEEGQYFEHGEARLVSLTGKISHAEVTSVRTTWDGRAAYQVIIRDISERKAAEARYEAVVASLSEGIVLFDQAGRVSGANDAAVSILGSRLQTGKGHVVFTGEGVARGTDGHVLGAHEFPHAITRRTGAALSDVVLGICDDEGEKRWLSVSTRLVPQPGAGDLVVCSFTDITARRAAEARVEWLAYHDPLTKLGNRPWLEEALEAELVRNRHEDTNLAVFFVDLDRFKMVNDSFGHQGGDEVLCAIAERFRTCVRSSDVISRFSGDEFVILCKALPSIELAANLADVYHRAVCEPITLSSGHEVTMGCSLGVAFVEGGAHSADVILQQADAAMFCAKKTGRGRVHVFDDALRATTVARIQDYDDLRRAIPGGELVLHYQPIADVGSNQVVGVEALVRWVHPTRGLLGPDSFVELAEESDLIFDLGRWVLGAACETMAAWKCSGVAGPESYVTVNLSTSQLADPMLLSSIVDTLERTGLDATGLVLEITESALMADTIMARKLLADIHELGVGLAIDDFGTGHSSLAQLKRFPVKVLKIDKAFIDEVATSELDAAIVTTIVQLGRTFGVRVVAEGIEHTAQLNRVAELGVDLYQGYLLSRPVGSDDVTFTGGTTRSA